MRPPLEFPACLTDDPTGVYGSTLIPDEAIPVFLLQLYILRYERQFFVWLHDQTCPLPCRILGYARQPVRDVTSILPPGPV